MTQVSKKIKEEDLYALEVRKVKALERISDSLDDISSYLEDIDKEEWSNRIQFYLSEFLKTQRPKDPTIDG